MKFHTVLLERRSLPLDLSCFVWFTVRNKTTKKTQSCLTISLFTIYRKTETAESG